MSRVVLFLLPCLMVLNILMPTEAVVTEVRHPDWQCQASNKYKAACYEHLHNGDYVDCMKLGCVLKGEKPNKDGLYHGISIGKAADGTHCNINKICKNGRCTDLTKNERLPTQYGGNNRIYNCYYDF